VPSTSGGSRLAERLVDLVAESITVGTAVSGTIRVGITAATLSVGVIAATLGVGVTAATSGVGVITAALKSIARLGGVASLAGIDC